MAGAISAIGPAEGQTEADMGRRHAEVFLDLLRGEGFARTQPATDVSQSTRLAAPRAAFARLARADLVGRRLERHRGVGGKAWDEPAKLDAQERRNRRSLSICSRPPRSARTAPPGRKPAHARSRRVSVSRSIFALIDDRDRAYFGGERRERGPGRVHRPRRPARSSAAAMPRSRMC